MSCENLKFNLPLYADDSLDENARRELDAHLPTCPVCRVRLAEYQTLRNELRAVAPPEVPADLAWELRNAVAARIVHSQNDFSFVSANTFEFFKFKIMPFAVGTVASLIIAVSFLSYMLKPHSTTDEAFVSDAFGPSSTVYLASNNNPQSDDYAPINPRDYASARLLVAGESPSLNPTGALVALTKSIVRGKMKDDEVVVVADVFSNGLAKISEVVEPPRDRETMQILENALQNDPNDAPFLPAQFDRRSDVVRVVFKIQRVDVTDSAPKLKQKIR